MTKQRQHHTEGSDHYTEQIGVLVEIETAQGTVVVNPLLIVAMREQHRVRVEHVEGCPLRAGVRSEIDPYAPGQPMVYNAGCERDGCITPLPSATEVLLLNTLSADSAITSEESLVALSGQWEDALTLLLGHDDSAAVMHAEIESGKVHPRHFYCYPDAVVDPLGRCTFPACQNHGKDAPCHLK